MSRTDLDLASRSLGGSVRFVNDELFAPGTALILPNGPAHDPDAFGPQGKIYDGWESRRRRTPGFDYAVVALAVPGVIHDVVVDTAFFKGNYPPEISIEGTFVDGSPDVGALLEAHWARLVPVSSAEGHSTNTYVVDDGAIYSHVRLNIYPDGGVARLRVLGTAVADPRLLARRCDLASILHGGDIAECSNMFYSNPRQALFPGAARSMAEGWETARRRGPGNDFLVVSLAAAAQLHYVDIDTSYFIGNAPGEIAVSTRSSTEGEWTPVLPRTAVVPDAHNRFPLTTDNEVLAVRLDAYPDGGLSRLRIFGEVAGAALPDLIGRWLERLPIDARVEVLTSAGLSGSDHKDLSDEQLAAMAW